MPTLKEIPSWLRAPPRVYTKPAGTREPKKAGPTWDQLVGAARATGHAEPERLASSMLKAREASLKISEDRPRTQMTVQPPKLKEASVASKPRGRAVVNDALRCRAMTLSGKRCGFKATHGDFCKKHAIVV